jgi:hypothetical protein
MEGRDSPAWEAAASRRKRRVDGFFVFAAVLGLVT